MGASGRGKGVAEERFILPSDLSAELLSLGAGDNLVPAALEIEHLHVEQEPPVWNSARTPRKNAPALGLPGCECFHFEFCLTRGYSRRSR